MYGHKEVELSLDPNKRSELDDKWNAWGMGTYYEMLSKGAMRIQCAVSGEYCYAEMMRRPTAAQKSAVRGALNEAGEVRIDITDPKTLQPAHWKEWGTPGSPRPRADGILRWMSSKGTQGLRGLGAPEHVRGELDNLKKCAVPAQSFDWGKGFILPDGSIVPTRNHNNIRDCVSPELANSFDYDTYQYHLVEDAILAGIVRMEFGTNGDLTFQTTPDITPKQRTTIGKLVKDSQRVYVDVITADEGLVRYNLWDVPRPHEVIKFISKGGESWTPLDGLAGFNASKITRSNRKGKKYKVRVCQKKKCKTIHFGATGYRIAPGTKKGDNYCARSSGIKGADDPMSANYWARRIWGCEGKKSIKWKALKVP